MTNMNPEPATKGPGEFLRQTRLRLGLEPDNVAQILHLSISQIAALEENNFDRLPGATYVRGYLRSYCQLLNVDSAPVLKAFEDATGAWKTTTYSNLVTERQVTSHDSIVRIATYGIAVVVVGLALVWWFGKGNQSPSQEVSDASPVPSLSTQSTAPEGETNSVPSTDTDTTAVAPTDGSSAPQMTSASNTSQAAPAGKSAAPEAAPPKPAVAKSAPQPAAAPAAKPVQKPKPVHTVAGDRSRLVLATSAPSWVDIRDSNNTRLLYETVAANRTISVEGEPPFQVFIGNAAAVTLSYDGKTIDVQSHQNGPTARFTVGATAGDNKVAD